MIHVSVPVRDERHSCDPQENRECSCFSELSQQGKYLKVNVQIKCVCVCVCGGGGSEDAAPGSDL